MDGGEHDSDLRGVILPIVIFNDLHKAVTWASEHWHIAGFACAALLVVDVWLVYLNLLTVRAGMAAGIAGVAYVVMETWRSTRPDRSNDASPKD